MSHRDETVTMLMVWRPAGAQQSRGQFGQVGEALAATTPEARAEFSYTSHLLADLGLDDPPGAGLWVWSGVMVHTTTPGEYGDMTYATTEVDWRGAYRRPAPGEISAFASGHAPWLFASTTAPAPPAEITAAELDGAE